VIGFALEQLEYSSRIEPRHRRDASTREQWGRPGHDEPEQVGERQHRQRMRLTRHCPRLDGRTSVREQIRVRQASAEQRARQRGGVDDGGLVTRPGRIGLAFQYEAVMRSEVDVACHAVGDQVRRPWRIVEQHAHRVRWETVRQRCDGKHRADVGVGDLVRNLGTRREGIDEHRAAPLGGRERGEERRRRRKENRRASSLQGAHQRRAPLQERQPRGDELLRFVAVDVSAAGGDRDGKEAERVAHGRKLTTRSGTWHP
jgi:hypothetical protein